MQIGVFDSGIGGLSVLYEALKQMPHEDYIYYADTANVPYGDKHREQVRHCIFDAVRLLAQEGINALIVACNTATSVAIQDIRRQYDFPIIGMEPAVKPAVNSVPNKRVMVFATPLTLCESKFVHLLHQVDTNNAVDFLPLQELVRFAEAFEFDTATVTMYLRDRLDGYDLNQYGAVVLGCTHFRFFEDHIRSVFPKDTIIIDGNFGTVRNLRKILISKNDFHHGTGRIKYYVSGMEAADTAMMERYLLRLRQIESPPPMRLNHKFYEYREE